MERGPSFCYASKGGPTNKSAATGLRVSTSLGAWLTRHGTSRDAPSGPSKEWCISMLCAVRLVRLAPRGSIARPNSDALSLEPFELAQLPLKVRCTPEGWLSASDPHELADRMKGKRLGFGLQWCGLGYQCGPCASSLSFSGKSLAIVTLWRPCDVWDDLTSTSLLHFCPARKSCCEVDAQPFAVGETGAAL